MFNFYSVSSSHCEDKLSIFNVAGALLSVLPVSENSIMATALVVEFQ